ncbi:MAG TPA: HAMP domain-containing sensor histidine kinase [Vicinamibacterales bacterium]|jgi:signal transduction histidine kinase
MPTPASETYPPLISLAVHELRTPVGVVSGYLRMLLRDTVEPLTPRQRKLIEDADRSCVRMAAIIAELSDVGKLDGDVIGLASQPVDVLPLVKDVVAQTHEGSDRDVHLTVRADDKPAVVIGDATRLKASFDAVFRSVLREKPGPAAVVADCRRVKMDGEDCLVVVVADEPALDEAFTRPRRPFVETRGGMGLALPLARRVIDGHRGRLESPQPVAGQTEAEDRLARSSAIITIPIARR